ncbi:hypothetical protein CONPUDRAFT_161500 [Coniophora puteana RWD-64-598 SS2]|uniref:Ima1 N-terminal domain-containing protein n=1 Tax=Coniophora puteana (strain RWD-64-598) TaxID=741705 RepID=A0A5M3N6L7_CONPW|nr:uncharacterized protein CONPUDRAFT_161500 [Coniophora puteana RWD-64-598 SS2]EIW86867.1 hypothetical protein CONPUDRAFT_161500 [Coniophora puteana RWD-64-598 SS2]
MPPLFRRKSHVVCFFCQSIPAPTPANPRAFKCPQCDCWNRYDSNGELVSDEPAMHDEALNTNSFARRASASKNHLPSVYGTTRTSFCHTCQTNQMLIVNLLSNYLPSPQHPDYARRLEMLPAYKESLHIRYPPVCEDCAPSVEAEIQQKDHMARTRALGGWLRQTRGKDKQRQVSSAAREKDKLWSHLLAWRIRGALWAATLVGVLMWYIAVLWGVRPPQVAARVLPILPSYFFFSLLWTVWDPTYYSFRKAQLQGRDVRLRGKRQYICLQLLAWGWRILTSSMLLLSSRDTTESRSHYFHLTFESRSFFMLSVILELSIIIGSLAFLRLDHPPPIRLIQTSNPLSRASSVLLTPDGSFATARSTPAPLSARSSHRSLEPDLSVLSLSSKPTMVPPSHPIFGHASLAPAVESAMDQDPTYSPGNARESDAMDWQPTDPRAQGTHAQRSNAEEEQGSWLRPQRFFAPEQPTGLETLFASTRLDDSPGQQTNAPRSILRRTLGDKRRVAGALSLLLSIVVAFLAGRWLRRSDGSTSGSTSTYST